MGPSRCHRNRRAAVNRVESDEKHRAVGVCNADRRELRSCTLFLQGVCFGMCIRGRQIKWADLCPESVGKLYV